MAVLMTPRKHNLIVLVSLVGAPILFFILGILGSIVGDKLYPQYKGTGVGLGVGLTWYFCAVIAFFASLLFGPLLSYIFRNNANPWVELSGYITPPILAFIFCVMATAIQLINVK